MTNPVLSNEVENRQVILWQYDHAPNLIGLIDGFNQIASDTVTQFWDYFRDSVFNIQTADTFGLNVLGRLMGLPRPSVILGAPPQGVTNPSELAQAAGVPDATSFSDVITALSSKGITESSTVQDAVDAVESGGSDAMPISDGLFRRLLLGRFFLFGMSPTVPNYNKYLNIIWGNDAPAVVDGFDMSMDFPPPIDNCDSEVGSDSEDEEVSYAEELAMHEQHPDLIYFYPAGIRTNESAASSKKVLGMAGQDLENFADAFSWVQNPTATGGIFAGNEKAKFLDGVTEEGDDNG